MTRYPHRIRLRGPWECEPLERGRPARPPPRRMTLPCRWADGGLKDFSGRVRFRRRFGYPGQIDAYERVWLTVAGVSDRGRRATQRRRAGKLRRRRAVSNSRSPGCCKRGTS